MEHEVFVPVEEERLREVLDDPARVARAVPGLQHDAGADPVAGRLKVRVGSHSVTYRGALRVAARDDGTYTVEGEASETRGSGTVKPALRLRLAPAGSSGTTLTVTGTATADGRVTELPPDAVAAAVTRLLNRFAENLGRAAEEPPEPPPAAPEPATDTDKPTRPGPVAGAGPTAAPDAERAPGPDAAPGPEAVSGPAAGSGPDAGPGPEGAAGPDAKPGPDAGPGSETASGPEAGPDSGAGPDADGESPQGEPDESGDGPDSPELLSTGDFEPQVTSDFETTPDADDTPPPSERDEPAPDADRASVFGTEIPPSSLDDEDDAGDEDSVAEAAHARRTMIGRSAEEVDHAPPRGRYAPVPAPQTVSSAASLRWAAPAAALAVASAVVAIRALRRRR
ncbi:SRPBCC domain-containing protein [Streptomyces sp. NPDC060077]|uniref:SRPBCC domain-containing protein n=1 Tax=Streptomyces sp. NPDC060077 TaxID=3347052 RepID=UPI003652CAE2